MPKLFNFGTNKQGLIVFGGETSVDYGMVVAEAPAFERAKRKQTIYNVPGRNGAVIFQQDAWEDVPRSYRVWLAKDRSDTELAQLVDAFEAWLNSLTDYQRLEDNFEPDVFRLAYYSGGIGFSNKLMQAGEATITFTCRAERFLKSGEQVIEIEDGSPLFNGTRFASKPLIHIEGSGAVTLTINGVSISANIEDYINIDCETMNAYRQPTQNMNNQIAGTFPTIAPGENAVNITGTVTKATVIPRFFTI